MSSPEALDPSGSALLSDTALAALELHEQPFAPDARGGSTTAPDRADASDGFTDDVTVEQLADIRQALITGDDLLLVLGERGAGKSTLLAQLAANSGLRIQCFSVGGSPRFSTRNLFMGILEAFKIEPPEDLKATLDELIPCLQAMLAGNKLCVVVLDDAEALADHELTTLLSSMLYVNSRDESLLRIALAAEPAFEDRIPDLLPEGADLPYSSLSLEPFDAERAAAYLGFRLERAGRFDELPFDETEIAAMNDRADGRPGALHVAAAAALEHAFGDPDAVPVSATDPSADALDLDADLPPELRESRRPSAAQVPFEGRALKLALGALAGAMIVGGLLLFRPTPEPGAADERYRVVEQRELDTARETERLRLLEEEDESRDVETAAADGNEDDTALALGPEADELPGPAEAPVLEEAPPAEAAAEEPAGASAAGGPEDAAEPVAEAPEAADDPAPEPSPDTPPDSPPDTPSEPPGDRAPQTEGGASPEAPEPEAAPAPDPDVGTEDAETASPETPDPETAPAEDDAPGDVARLDGAEAAPSPVAPPPEEPVLGSLESPNWVLTQNPGQYTVQMSASTDRASVEEFLAQADLPPPNSIFTFDRNGRTWYALVHGLFPSVAEARSAVERMSSAAQSNQPWIRAVGRIQETLREQN